MENYDDEIQRDIHQSYGDHEGDEYAKFTAGINLRVWSIVIFIGGLIAYFIDKF
jgi:hypothetical protein